MSFLVDLVVAVLRALLPALLARLEAQPSSEDGTRSPELGQRLRARVRSAGWPAALLLAAVLLTGCAPRTIYVPPGEPVRLRETIRNAKVWVLDKDGVPSPGRVDLPEGWYVLPDYDGSAR